MIRKILFLLIFIIDTFFCCGQTKIVEQLKYKIASSTNQEEKLKYTLELCNQGYSLHPDTLMLYARSAEQLAINSNDLNKQIEARYYIAFAYTNNGLLDSALVMSDLCITELSKTSADHILLANIYNQKGRCYVRKNKYKEAIDMGYKMMNEADKAGNILLQIKSKTLIGWAYLEMGQYHKALSWHLDALRSTTDSIILQKYAILFANIAVNYLDINKIDSGLFFIEKAVNYARKNDNLFALSNSLAIKAQLLVKSGKNNMAEAALKEVVLIRRQIGDPFYIVSDMGQLGMYYAHNGQQIKGIKICNEGIEIANQFKLGTKLFFLYSALAENYKTAGNNLKYAETLQKIINLKDSVYQHNSERELAVLQSRFDVQKKENLIIAQKLQLIQKNYFVYGALLLFVITIIASLIIFNGYKKRQKLEFLIIREEERRASLQMIFNAEEAERKRIGADLHDNLGAYASAISANVDELLRSSSSNKLDNYLKSINENANEIMFSLRDTIWVLNRETILLTGISDRFKSYINKIAPAYQHVNVELVEQIENDIVLTPHQAINMLRIMQEAFHNSLKHSHCSNITITIISRQKINIIVRDNGLGIDSAVDSTGGIGIDNMKRRARMNGWNLMITQVNPGTLMELIV